MSNLKDEINRLRRKIGHMDDRKAIQRLKTEDRDHLLPEHNKLQCYKQSFYLGSNDTIRNST
jgi:hypothetical protein